MGAGAFTHGRSRIWHLFGDTRPAGAIHGRRSVPRSGDDSLGDATTQRLRWYGGVFDLQKRYVKPLFRAALLQRNPAALDLLLELLLPSFSTLALTALLLTVLTGILWAANMAGPGVFVISLALSAAAGVFPFLGLAAEHAPWHTFRALLYGPAYAAWRVWIGVKVQMRRGNVLWVRTRRTEEDTGAK